MTEARTNPAMLNAVIEHLRQNYDPLRPVKQLREAMSRRPEGVPQLDHLDVEKILVSGLTGEWVKILGQGTADHQAILYFHGGGFAAGTCEYYRDMAARISRASGIKVLTFEYRLAPEHSYPAANEDALKAYRWLRNQGYTADNIVFGGDSVGATLALMTLLTLRDRNEELPAGGFLMSPHTDLIHLEGESYIINRAADPTGSLEGNRRIAELYIEGWGGPAPEILSPLRMPLHGLPPLLVQAGSREVLLSDATRLQQRAGEAGVDVRLEIWDNMWSVFQFLAYLLPEADQAIGNVGRFVKERLA
ncbi:alpha/beta hydrolase [Paenibacillus tuaregi]|uniref:alpha/beta hydrolase n=1 Tax=Paenibacillus tuaregi TaxID=1816681 RepID=UPI0009EE4656|nr:alpha/beta hydrolase [Paenibacillus tuaregi]